MMYSPHKRYTGSNADRQKSFIGVPVRTPAHRLGAYGCVDRPLLVGSTHVIPPILDRVCNNPPVFLRPGLQLQGRVL